ncbi:SMI1/KNR4 family protein [Streptomyces sp. NPDC060065]|uniref:SMI1/KNR4 family protein n=1 Tax=Streptomyces sp. NPDC060065 TaxID=3347050 RepID=UPI0036A22324
MIQSMGELSYSAAWLSRWREEITETVSAMLATFEETHGFAPGLNEVRVAGEDDRRAAREYAREFLGFAELLTFYESIGEVVLPDVGNGYFIHSARDVLHRLAEEGPVFIPMADDPHGMVIASDGGGFLFVADWGGVIHRSRTASLDEGEFDMVAEDLPQFLELIRRSVARFVETGEPGYL